VVTSMLDVRNDARNEGGAYQRVEVITGRQRRRRWPAEEKARIVAESLEADANISDVARRHGLARGLLTIWRRQLSGGGQEPGQSFAAVKIDTVAPLSDGTARHLAESDAVGSTLPAIWSRGRIEIDVAGARIRIESGVDHATLAMVLAVVRGDK
jgi:transposase